MTDTWDTIADWYTDRVAGSPLNAFSRDLLLSLLPADLTGARVLDLGCGEGLVTRALAGRGADVYGVDLSPRMIEHARRQAPPGTRFGVDDGCRLDTVDDASQDWVVAGLALNNVPELHSALAATRRVLRPGGALAFTVPHPCFEAPHASWTPDGRRVVGDYATEGFWRSANPHGARRAGNEHRALATYFTALTTHGLRITHLAEPLPGAAVAAEQPHRAALPPFLAVRADRA